MPDKNDFRPGQIARLKAAAAQTQAESAALLSKLMATALWQQAQTIATTVSSPLEVATAPLMAAAQQAGKQILLARVMPKRQMAFLPDPGPAGRITSKFGLAEPPYDAALVNQNPDLMIVPGIGFSLKDHYRIGFGGGYYDRFLAQYAGPTVALVPSVMAFATPQWPVESFDIPIQTLIQL
ncbi:5-formyltetrahydrofolate cyclo-ligase [Lacticaseibacillus salsurivasis]|uniref:5-formyltetrahydrofolate cyclo-ligase n=1 Tax=Lacticaseibacillus salsurivasis TaxID=3081441 RepID=UPI0030C76249